VRVVIFSLSVDNGQAALGLHFNQQLNLKTTLLENVVKRKKNNKATQFLKTKMKEGQFFK
jgi:hypothetical protein